MNTNYITMITYIAVILVFFGGAKFAGFKGLYHDDFMERNSTRNLRGLAALLILFHHISQEQTFMESGTIQAFLNLGPALVAIFFFCSGYGLIKNLDSNPAYLDGFIKRRIVIGIMIPFYVNVILYGIYNLATGVKYEPVQLLTKLTGLTLMNDFAWFPVVLFLIYLAFYFIFKNVKNQKLCFLLIFLVIIGQGIFFAHWGHFAWWAGDKKNWWMKPNGFANAKWWMQERVLWFYGQWWVNSSIGFFVGMVMARKEDKIISFFKSKYYLKLAIAIVLLVIFNLLSMLCQWNFGYYTEFMGMGPGILQKIITYFSQLPQITAFLIVVTLIRMKIKISNPVTGFFGKYALHTYLMNLMALKIFYFMIYEKGKAFYKPFNYNLAAYIIAVILASMLMGVIEEKICAVIIKWFTKRKEKC